MVTGIPGVGKTTLLDRMQSEFQRKGFRSAVVDEYRFLLEWSKLPNSQAWLFPRENSFDIRPEGYRLMSSYVARRVAEDIQGRLEEGVSAVMFETARGVGDPMVTYVGFVSEILDHLPDMRSEVLLSNIEVTAPLPVVEERLQLRYLENRETAMPPEAVYKYLDPDGQPLVSSVDEFRRVGLDLPIVLNERISNGTGKEAFWRRLEGSLLPTIFEGNGMLPGSEGPMRLHSPER